MHKENNKPACAGRKLMKYIFDFDDVLFYTTKKFIPHEYVVLEKVGISRIDIENYYKDIKLSNSAFSMKKMLEHFSVPEEIYKEIMQENKNYLNQELVSIVMKLGKENCFILSFGDEEFQIDKIKTSGIEHLFSQIIVVKNNKKDFVEKICNLYKDEQVFFIDDKEEYLSQIDFAKCQNLKTVLYTGQKDFKSLLLP